MLINKRYQAYEYNAVNTASGGELTLMLYNACIRFIKQANKDMTEENYEDKNIHIQKAQTIIQELMITLDPKIELTNQLLPLYDYILHILSEANIKNEVNLLEEALDYIKDFRDTWKQVILKDRQAKNAQGAKT